MKAYIDAEKGLNINGKTIQKAVCKNSVIGGVVCLTFTDGTFILLRAGLYCIDYEKPHETDLLEYEYALIESEAMTQEEFNAIKKAVKDRCTAHEKENNLLQLHTQGV